MLREQVGYLAVTVVVLFIAVIVESIVPIERVSWKSRARGALFLCIIMIGGPLIAFGLSRLWQMLGIALPIPPLEQWAGWAAVPIALVAGDFLRYWEHRFEHRFYWSVHRVHHSPNELHALTNYGHPLHMLPLFFLVLLPLSMLGFDRLETPWAVGIIASLIVTLSHSPADFHYGPLRYLIIDNRFHRIHHSLDAQHFDRNFGVIFPWWDVLFGTAHFPTPSEWPKVGVAGVKEPRKLSEFLMLPFPSTTAELHLPKRP